ncbi:hypothetical protein [Aurantivibrio plasticivorans]
MTTAKIADDFQQALDCLNDLYEVPEYFEVAYAQQVSMDRRPLWWMRFIKKDGTNNQLEGEHLSLLVDMFNSRLMGFTYLDSENASEESPDESRSSDMALSFMSKAAPDIYPNLSVKWVQPLSHVAKNPPHDSALYYVDQQSGEKQTLLGTRVKMVDSATGLYAWVVVNENGEVLNFERDIHWSTLRGRRTTEVWLHDAYPSHPGRKVIPTDAAKLIASFEE